MKNKIYMKNKILALAVGMVAASGISAWANPIDILGPPGLSTTIDNGATLTIADPKGSGSGAFDAFVRFGPNKSGLSEGMNTDIDHYLDNNPPAGPNMFTRDVQASWVQVNEDGYYIFRFDAGNPGSTPVTLQTIKLFTSPTQLTTTAALDALRLTAPVWQALNPGGYNVKDQSGQGIADLYLLVPQSMINDGYWIYLDTQSGGSPYPDNGTFNQWSFLERTTPPPSVPDAGTTAMLLGTGLAVVAGLRRKLSV